MKKFIHIFLCSELSNQVQHLSDITNISRKANLFILKEIFETIPPLLKRT